jgi:hypothetical protein
MRFRKLPVEIEVVEQVEERKEVETPEGFLEASPGDVIVRGVHGEKYPVKPEIFAKTYVPSDPSDLDSFEFYDDVVPEGVQVYLVEGDGGEVAVEGVAVTGQDDLGPDEWDRAVEFARELSAVLGLGDPPLDVPNGDEGTNIVCNECGHVRETTEENPTLASCENCGSYELDYQEGDV